MILRFAGYVIGSMVGVLTLGTLFQGGIVNYDTVSSVLVFSLVLGVLMAFIKPVLATLSLPISCLTFGLFAFVINAGLFWIAGLLTSGVDATAFGCVLGGAIVSALGGIVFAVLDE